MTDKQLSNYVETENESEFTYNDKRYSITYYSDDKHEKIISFCEFYQEPSDYFCYEDFKNNAQIDGKFIVEILESIDDADVF